MASFVDVVTVRPSTPPMPKSFAAALIKSLSSLSKSLSYINKANLTLFSMFVYLAETLHTLLIQLPVFRINVYMPYVP